MQSDGGRIPQVLVGSMREAGLVGMRGPLEQGGQDLCVTETMRLLESATSLSSPSLGEALAALNSRAAVEAIERCGDDRMRSKYIKG